MSNVRTDKHAHKQAKRGTLPPTPRYKTSELAAFFGLAKYPGTDWKPANQKHQAGERVPVQRGLEIKGGKRNCAKVRVCFTRNTDTAAVV